jgi:hypothetical protein
MIDSQKKGDRPRFSCVRSALSNRLSPKKNSASNFHLPIIISAISQQYTRGKRDLSIIFH